MTIKRYAGDKLVGLSSDAKPTNIPDGATFYETDTLTSFLLVSGAWSAVGGGGGQPFTTPEVKTTSWSVTNADKGKVFVVDTDNLTLTLPDSSTLDDDWFIRLYTKGNSFQPSYGVVGDLTIDPQYSTIGGRVNGNTTWITRSRQGGILFKDPEQTSNYIFDVHSTTWDIDVHSTANANRANATGWGSIAISGQATASGNSPIAIGYLATASGTDSVAIGGNSAQATATDAIAIGNSLANAANGIAIGINNSTTSYGATATDGIAIGQLAKAPTADGIAIGKNANANNGAIAIGYNSYTTAVRGVAVGYDTYAGYQAATFGYGNSATGNFSLTVGHSNTASHVNSAAIGYGVQTTASNQVALGGSTQTVRISETYTLPATDGTIGQVLTTDGAGAVTFADAGGGGAALELYAENPSSPTAPSATGDNAVAIGSGSVSAATNSIAINTGDALYGVIAGATNGIAIGYQARVRANVVNSLAIGFSADVNNTQSTAVGYNAHAFGTNSQAFGSGAYSANDRALALGYNTSAGTAGSTALGSNSASQGSVVATGAGAMALGGSYASGTDSFAAAITNNTATYGATGANSVAIGELAKASGQKSFSVGYATQATGTYSYSLGRQAQATQEGAIAIGSFAKSAVIGKVAIGGFSPNNIGDSQAGVVNLYSDTGGATPEALTTNNSAAGTTNQVILPNNSAYAFHGTIVARQQASTGTACAAWKIEGLIRREGSAGTTVLVNSATTVLDNTPAWGMALSADTTNGGLKIEVTGAAATNIRWVATINTSEVTY